MTVLKYFKFLLPLILIFLIAGCSIKKDSSSNTRTDEKTYSQDLPSWFINSPNNNANTLYGVGEGKSLEDSRTNALNNMSSKIMVSIDSSLETTKISSNKDYQKSIKQDITQEIEKLKYQNIETKNATKVGDTYYSLVSVDRKKLFNEQKKELERVDNYIDNKYNESKNKSSFIKVINLENIKSKIEQNSKYAYKIYAIENSFDYVKYVDKYDKILNELDRLKSDLAIHISADKNKAFYDELKSVLNKNGYKVLTNKAKSEIELKLDNNIDLTEVKGWNIAKVNSSISVTTASMPLSLEDKIISTTTISSLGRSTSSSNVAIINASKDFTKQLEKIGLEKILFNKQEKE